MNSKSTKVKKFIKDAGVTDQLFVFAGSIKTNSFSNSTQTATDLWTQSDFSIRVGQNSLTAVVPYVKWVQRRPYKSWSANIKNTGNFYAYNDQNGYVYLCISDNEKNRTDLAGQNVSNVRPSHTSGIQRYSDGYAWKPLYKITGSMERFVSSTWLPVLSFENFDNELQTTQLQQTVDFCNSDTGKTGFCGIYAKLPLSTDDNSGTIEYDKGDLFTIASPITCSDCFYMMFNNEKFKSVFYETSENVAQTISVLDNYTLVGNLISSGELGQFSPYYYLYTINENDELSEGSIVSAFIDLKNFTTTELVSTIQNPELILTSGSGYGGRIILKTEIINGTYVIQGIEIISRGSNYKEIKASIDSSVVPNLDSTVLISAITINLDTIDGIGFDPVDVLDAEHVMIDARLEKRFLEDAGIILPPEVNFFGLIKNPFESATGVNIIAGSNKNKKIDVIYRTSIKAGITSEINGLFPSEEEEIPLQITTENLSTSQIISITPTIKVGGVKQITDNTAQTEFKGLLYSEADLLIGKTFGTKGTVNTIGTIEAKPTFIQFSGIPLATNRQPSNLSISDIDSVIVRINMVQGM